MRYAATFTHKGAEHLYYGRSPREALEFVADDIHRGHLPADILQRTNVAPVRERPVSGSLPGRPVEFATARLGREDTKRPVRSGGSRSLIEAWRRAESAGLVKRPVRRRATATDATPPGPPRRGGGLSLLHAVILAEQAGLRRPR